MLGAARANPFAAMRVGATDRSAALPGRSGSKTLFKSGLRSGWADCRNADIPRFQAYDYRRLDVRSDDDEEYYLTVSYSESVSAWRLRDGRWLVHRRVEPLGDEDVATSALSIDARMPR